MPVLLGQLMNPLISHHEKLRIERELIHVEEASLPQLQQLFVSLLPTSLPPSLSAALRSSLAHPQPILLLLPLLISQLVHVQVSSPFPSVPSLGAQLAQGDLVGRPTKYSPFSV